MRRFSIVATGVMAVAAVLLAASVLPRPAAGVTATWAGSTAPAVPAPPAASWPVGASPAASVSRVGSNALVAASAGAVPGGGSAAPAAPGLITERWAHLFLDGKPYRFLSFNAPNAATLWSVNYGCGAQPSDADFDYTFSHLPPHTIIPFWATEAMAWDDRGQPGINFAGIDRVFAAAVRNHQYLMPELGTQQGYCSDGRWKDAAWYSGGYRQSSDVSGLEPLSYWDWVHLVVPRYKDSPALAMWTLMVEPEADNCDAGYSGADCYGHKECPENATAALRSFFDVVGAEVKRLDPEHLINSGTLGGGQCGTQGSNYTYVNASPGIDVCDMHDYEGPESPITQAWIGEVQACQALGKASIVGETGLMGATVSGNGCEDLQARAASFKQRFDGFFAAGASGLSLWAWSGLSGTSCGLGVSIADPVIDLMKTYMPSS